MNAEVTHQLDGNRGQFQIERDSKAVARLNYVRDGARVEILHTEVDSSLRGTGAGGALVAAAVDWARAEQLQIIPVCPFARSVFAKTPEYEDVLSSR
jgi:predicted GNAT family acetyltransferase